jgi:hypothetical protein
VGMCRGGEIVLFCVFLEFSDVWILRFLDFEVLGRGSGPGGGSGPGVEKS